MTDAQYERHEKIKAALDELSKKEDELSEAYDVLDAKINTLEEELWSLEEENDRIESESWESKRKLCIEKLKSMDIEVRPEIVKSPEKKPEIKPVEPEPQRLELQPAQTTTKRSLLGKLLKLIRR